MTKIKNKPNGMRVNMDSSCFSSSSWDDVVRWGGGGGFVKSSFCRSLEEVKFVVELSFLI